jgi:protein-S-isoprenylcysteine O-methyltransferase Ste14
MATSESFPNAGVRFPPPLLYLLGLVVGWIAQHYRPLPITVSHSGARTGLGILSLAIWALLSFSAVALFRRAGTSLIPNKPSAAFVTTGPYRWTRNPMYVSLIALYIGLTLLTNSWWPMLFLPLVVLLIDRLVIAREERYLSSAFPAEYGAYAARVRRWL